MIDLKEWLEFKLATAEEVIEVEVKIWLEQYNKVNELQPLISDFGKWKGDKAQKALQDYNNGSEVGEYPNMVQGYTKEEMPTVKIASSPAYKVGDKVEVVDRRYGHKFDIGEIIEIKEVNDINYNLFQW